MQEVKLNIKIELAGHNARIKHIWSSLSKENALSIWVEIDGQPEGLAGMAISIPAKEYSREELLVVIKKQGDKQVADAIAERKKEIEEHSLQRQRHEKLHDLAKKAVEVLQG
jgi:hypothetical protein